ncbi:MAG: exodeoxyribonuclease VII small subunit [Bacteroidales bacterium]|nr:exodeoxyribonuclease VII small subunit [Bacteroidales bacterium]
MSNNNISYQKAFEELQTIVNKMENSGISIDELGVKIKRASELLKICRDKLYETEENISDTLKEIGEFADE